MNNFCKQILICILTISIYLPIFAQEVKIEDGHFLEGVKNYNIGNVDEAIDCFKKTLEVEDDNDAAHYYIGLSYARRSEADLTELHLRKAIELDPSNYWYRITLAELYAQTKRMDLALNLYEQLTVDFPKKSSVYYDIIDLYTSAGQIDSALTTLTTIEKVKGENEATVNARFDLQRMKGDQEGALETLNKLNADYPSARGSYLLGEFSKSNYQDSIAIAAYTKAIELDPKYTPAYFGLAEVYMVKRQFNLYFDNINVFLSSPEMPAIMKSQYIQEMVFNPQFVQTFLPQVDTMIANVVTAHPKDSSAMYLAGTYNIQTGRKEEGVKYYKEIFELYPSDNRAVMEYVSVLYYMQEWNTLIAAAKQALGVFPNDISLTEILGSAYWQTEQTDKAIECYTSITKYGKENQQILLSAYTALGDLYHTKGNSSKCFSYYKKALKINPEHIPVLNNYAYFLSVEKKNLKKAYQMSKKTVLREPDNPTYLDTYGWILYLLGDYEDARNQFKHAMLYGGQESAVILDHYGDVLFALGEYDLAFLYWEQGDRVDPSLKLKDKIKNKKEELKK